ncbi:hypothetical protein HMF8227_02432 [Saliniradius amylolyticus]|uniref:DUF3545 domain-containing protein n=1 Tax=Saliniradius amylolyticus TaxID=2183582 RepID=A0A2S2E5F1_9ALTE|nr:DUF3545 family protein [Saliniradius amylolyticus]AWL12884.1 hypothetical protein HMF8227_02432 [Saliniradius amylolyticus]
MDQSDLMSMLDIESRPTKTTNSKKRKWREIEAIHDQYKLRKELSEMDMLLDYELNEAGL